MLKEKLNSIKYNIYSQNNKPAVIEHIQKRNVSQFKGMDFAGNEKVNKISPKKLILSRNKSNIYFDNYQNINTESNQKQSFINKSSVKYNAIFPSLTQEPLFKPAKKLFQDNNIITSNISKNLVPLNLRPVSNKCKKVIKYEPSEDYQRLNKKKYRLIDKDNCFIKAQDYNKNINSNIFNTYNRENSKFVNLNNVAVSNIIEVDKNNPSKYTVANVDCNKQRILSNNENNNTLENNNINNNQQKSKKKVYILSNINSSLKEKSKLNSNNYFKESYLNNISSYNDIIMNNRKDNIKRILNYNEVNKDMSLLYNKFKYNANKQLNSDHIGDIIHNRYR